MTAIAKQASPDVLSKAVTRAAERLNVSESLLAKVIGVSPATATATRL
jgi:hypothetical protein